MKHPFKKTLIALGLLFFILTVSCDKDFNEAEPQTVTPQQNSRFKVNTGDKVSKKAIGYLKQKTNSSLKVNLGKNLVALSDGNMLSRASALGTVDTSKEVVVTNTYNVKHTFKVITDDGEPNSVLNIIVVETEDGIFEYFMKYIFEDKLPLNSDGSLDIQSFTGTVETYNNLGELTGTVTLSSGSVVAVTGQNSPCPDEDIDEDDDTDDDGSTSSGGSPGGATSGDGSDDSDPDPNGGGEFVNPYDEEGCEVYVQTITCWCEGNLVGAHDHTNERSFLVIRCGGYVVTTAQRNMAYRDPGSDDPCGFGDTGVLIDEEAVHENNCDELARALNNTEFKNKIEDLKDLLETDPEQGRKESGFSAYENSQGVLNTTAITQSEERGIFRFRLSSNVLGGGHLHTNIVHPMFSFHDLHTLYKFSEKFENNGNPPDASKPFLILVTLPQSNPQVYAIKIEDINKLNAFMENLTQLEIESYEKKIENKYRLAERSTSDPGPTLYQKTFLEYIAEKNIGISLYQANDNLTSWSKKSQSTNGNQVITQNCNE